MKHANGYNNGTPVCTPYIDGREQYIRSTFRNDSQHTGLVFLPGWIIPVALVVAVVVGRIFYILLEKPTRSAVVEKFTNRLNSGYSDNTSDNNKKDDSRTTGTSEVTGKD